MAAIVVNGGVATPDTPAVPPPATSATHWFLRGAMVGVLLSAAGNGVSYFVRSRYYGILGGDTSVAHEALGFPWLMWEEGNAYGGYFVDLLPLGANLAVGLALAAALGGLTLWFRPTLDDLEQQILATLPARSRQPWQLSLRGLLALMGLAALAAIGVRLALAGNPRILTLIYVLGPWGLVATAFVPLGMTWQQRVAVIVPITLLLMLGAVAAGARLRPPLPFDKVLLGIFVCWTPQAVLVSVAISVVAVARFRASFR